MRRHTVLFWVLGMLMFTAHSALAQRPGGRGGFGPPGGGPFGGGPGLLTQESIQKELKLSDDQVKQAKELADQQRGSFGGNRDLSREERQKRTEERMKASDSAIAKILNADQLKRFRQISYQQRGAQALADPEVADALKLSDDQKERIRSVQRDTRDSMRDLFQGGGGDPEEMRPKVEQLRKTADDKAQGILTPDQQSKWKELQGDPFKGEIRRPNFRGRNRSDAGTPRQDAARELMARPRSPFHFASLSLLTESNVDAADREDSAPRGGSGADDPPTSNKATDRTSASSATNQAWDHVASALRHRHGMNPRWRAAAWRHRHWRRAHAFAGGGYPHWAGDRGSMRFGQRPHAHGWTRWDGPRGSRDGGFGRFAGGPGQYRRGGWHDGFGRGFGGDRGWAAPGGWDSHRRMMFAMAAPNDRGPRDGWHHGPGRDMPPWASHHMWGGPGRDGGESMAWRRGPHGPDRGFGHWNRLAGFAPDRDGGPRAGHSGGWNPRYFHTADMSSTAARISELQDKVDQLTKELEALRKQSHP